MNLLVTGATGFIGRRLVERLLDRGDRVVALVRAPGALAPREGLTQAIGTLPDRAILAAASRGCDAVIHLANATGVSDPAAVRAINVDGTAALLEAARAAGVGRFIFVSSISARRERLGPYGATKREAEQRVRDSGVRYVILRPSLVYGSGGVGLVASLAAYLRRLPVVPVIGSGENALDPIHLEDVCEVIVQCLERNDVLGGEYDLLGPDPVTFNRFLDMLSREIGVSKPKLHIPGPVAMLMARGFGIALKRPPLTVDNVLGMISRARVDRAPAARDFPIRWTPLAEGLTALMRPPARIETAPRPDTTAAPEPATEARAVPDTPLLERAAGPSRAVRVGVVGLGKMGAVHTAVLAMIPGVEIGGLADLEPRLGKTLRGMGFSAPFHPSLERLLAASRLDAVWLCTPPDSHLPLTKMCVEAGVSVFVEKPLAHTLEDAEAIAALARAPSGSGAGARIACGYAQLFLPSFAVARQALEQGVVGRVRRVKSAMYLSQVFGPQRGWMFDAKRSGGGVVANLSSHLLSLLAWYFGLPVSAHAHWKRLHGSVEDELSGVFQLADGAEITFESSWSVPDYPISGTFIRVEGESGTLAVSNETLELDLATAAAGWPAGQTRLAHPQLPQPARFDLNGEFYWLEDAHALAWFTGGATPPITAAAALDVQRMMEALYRSAARNGERVRVPGAAAAASGAGMPERASESAGKPR